MNFGKIVCIVTIKLLKNNNHNPKDKKSGKCGLHLASNSECTDVTGEHHSCVMEGDSIKEIKERAKILGHVTRIEQIHNVIILESY